MAPHFCLHLHQPSLTVQPHSIQCFSYEYMKCPELSDPEHSVLPPRGTHHPIYGQGQLKRGTQALTAENSTTFPFPSTSFTPRGPQEHSYLTLWDMSGPFIQVFFLEVL